MASNETIKQAVMAGMGVSFISRHTIDLETANGTTGGPGRERHAGDQAMARRASGEEAPLADRRRVQTIRADAGTLIVARAGSALAALSVRATLVAGRLAETAQAYIVADAARHERDTGFQQKKIGDMMSAVLGKDA